jgi:hypothetical protein
MVRPNHTGAVKFRCGLSFPLFYSFKSFSTCKPKGNGVNADPRDLNALGELRG